MRTPEHFIRNDGLARTLAPFSGLYSAVSRLKRRFRRSWQAPIPVICVGNLTAGGAGKTPVALALGALLRERDQNVQFLSRGYGGCLRGPVKVERHAHFAGDVGDEPLLLAEAAPTWVSRDRVAGAKAAIEDGATVIVMDDGFQNPSLAKTLSLVVVDGGFGFGNGRTLPAGPLREPIEEGLARADAIILVEPDLVQAADTLGETSLPVIRARLAPSHAAQRFAGRKVVAFAGIGRPEKFFATLESLGCMIITKRGFPDHHKFNPDEIMRMVEIARAAGAMLVTTDKDYVRLSPDSQAMVEAVPVTLEWRNPQEIETLIDKALTA